METKLLERMVIDSNEKIEILPIKSYVYNEEKTIKTRNSSMFVFSYKDIYIIYNNHKFEIESDYENNVLYINHLIELNNIIDELPCIHENIPDNLSIIDELRNTIINELKIKIYVWYDKMSQNYNKYVNNKMVNEINNYIYDIINIMTSSTYELLFGGFNLRFDDNGNLFITNTYTNDCFQLYIDEENFIISYHLLNKYDYFYSNSVKNGEQLLVNNSNDINMSVLDEIKERIVLYYETIIFEYLDAENKAYCYQNK